MLNQLFSLLIFFSVNKNYIDKKNFDIIILQYYIWVMTYFRFKFFLKKKKKPNA